MSIVGVFVSLGEILFLMTFVVRSSSSSSGIVRMTICEARFAIHLIWIWHSVLLSVTLLISLKSDLLLDDIELLLLIWRHIVLNIVLICTVIPFLSDRSLRFGWESLINLWKMTIVVEVVIGISRRCRSNLATRSYHIVEAIYLGRGWGLRSRIIRSKITMIFMRPISDDLEAILLPLILQCECVCHYISHIKGIFGSLIWRSRGSECSLTLGGRTNNIIMVKVVASLLKGLCQGKVILMRKVGWAVVVFIRVTLSNNIIRIRRVFALDLVSESGVGSC